MNLIIKARDFAIKAHDGQKRKWTNEPYIIHPTRVAMSVLQLHGSTEEMVAAAYLHDVIEDCGIEYKEILDEFGPLVAEYVLGLTSGSKVVKSKSKRYLRKQMDLEFIAVQCREVHLLKLEDRWDNVCDMADCPDTDFVDLYEQETRELLQIISYADPDLAKSILTIFEVMKTKRTNENPNLVLVQ